MVPSRAVRVALAKHLKCPFGPVTPVIEGHLQFQSTAVKVLLSPFPVGRASGMYAGCRGRGTW
jgi:hypothetical protein